MKPCVSSFLALAVASVTPVPTPATAEEPGAPPAVVRSTGSYVSQGKPIRVERFEPAGEGKYPAVLILHGSTGMTVGGRSCRETGARLAGAGFVAEVIHYFDATGTFIADKPRMIEGFPVWLQVVADGLTDLAKRPNVDPDRFGLVGYSLGGYLSVSLSMYDPRITAVVDYFGGLPGPLTKDVKQLPPTLILHGDADRIVPVSEARTLEALFKERNLPYELKVYAGQGHYFLGDDATDADARAQEFLERHVKEAKAVVRHEVARPRFDEVEELKAEAVTGTPE